MAVLAAAKLNEMNSVTTRIVDGPVVRLDRAETLNERISYAVRMEKNLALSSDDQQMHVFDDDLMRARSETCCQAISTAYHRSNTEQVQKTFQLRQVKSQLSLPKFYLG